MEKNTLIKLMSKIKEIIMTLSVAGCSQYLEECKGQNHSVQTEDIRRQRSHYSPSCDELSNIYLMCPES